MLLLTLAASASAWAGPDLVPDASWRAVADHTVRIELDGAPAVEGRVLAFDATSVTIVAAPTHEVITLPRDRVRRLLLVDLALPAAAAAPPPVPEPHRMWGIHFGLPGTLAVDVDYGRWHAFASPNVLLPVLTESGESAWYAAAIGAGVSLHVSSRWKLDAFAVTMPLHYTSFYTYLATGVGIGFHHTGASGLSWGFTLPVLGFAKRIGHSPYGYDAPFRYNDSLDYFYLAGFTTLPLVTIGYRLPCRHAR